MYSKPELECAAEAIRKIAFKYDVSEAEVRGEIEYAIHAAMKSHDLRERENGLASLPGKHPTAEEWILWFADRVLDEA